MRTVFRLAMGMVAACLGGCETTTHAIFVTSTSLGFNYDSAPPSASIAYDRTEGFIGPGYDDGSLPPVLATLQTDGNVVAPKIRQIYGTGAAAIIASGGTATGPKALGTNPHTVFIGTTTTIGLKASFGSDNGLTGFNLGFKRKEFSDLPLLGSPPVYPSVLASIDMTASSTSPSGVTLTSQQFIATGPAAEALAASDAGSALRTSVNHTANQAAVAAGQADAAALKAHLDNVVRYVTANGTWDTARLATIVNAAKNLPTGIAPILAAEPNEAKLRRDVGTDETTAASLDTAILKG